MPDNILHTIDITVTERVKKTKAKSQHSTQQYHSSIAARKLFNLTTSAHP